MDRLSYDEAANILNVKKGTIVQAVVRGDLTQIPNTGKVKYLLREQVELFVGKQISRNSLNDELRKKWEDLDMLVRAETVNNSSKISPVRRIEQFGDELGDIASDHLFTRLFSRFTPDTLESMLKKKLLVH